MSDKYKIQKGNEAYFVTFTIVEWVKVLEDDSFKQIIIDNIQFYQKNKGLVDYGYCVMPNHVHMIVSANEPFTVSEILRDLKKFTSRAIVKKLEDEKPGGYQQILDQFSKAGKNLKRIKNYKVWQDGNMAKIIFSNKFLMQKLSYIHNNPVEYGLCSLPWDYKFSSAVNYSGKVGLLNVELLSLQMNTIR
ncbi:MAG: transposase [Bacteroidales bacterium]|nr:transposase [Bacteroidales bacterium]